MALFFKKKQTNKQTKTNAYPHVQSAGVWDVVVDVTVITQTHDGETDQGAHVQGQDGDEQRLGALQVAVEEDGHEHDLRERRTRALSGAVEKSAPTLGGGGAYLSHHVRDGRRAHDEAVLVLEENPRVDPGLRSKAKGGWGHGRRGSGAWPTALTHHGVQQRERGQEQERLPRLASHRFVHMVELVYDVVPQIGVSCGERAGVSSDVRAINLRGKNMLAANTGVSQRGQTRQVHSAWRLTAGPRRCVPGHHTRSDTHLLRCGARRRWPRPSPAGTWPSAGPSCC